MSKLTIKNKITWIISIISVSLLFFIFLFFQNGTTLIITMKSSTKAPLKAKLYFAKEGQSFIEENSKRAYKINKNRYYFKLPKAELMQYLRFDPTGKKSKVSISNITLSTTKWFTTTLYNIPTTHIIPVHQIAHFKSLNNKISFSTTGNDPHFNMQLFPSTHISTTQHIHLNLLIIALVLFTVLLYILHIYKTKKLYYNSNLRLDTKDFSICQK